MRSILALVLTLILTLLSATSAAASAADDGWHVDARPVDPAQLTGLPFGTRSFYAQPWRAYEETVPTRTLLDAVGINFNVSPTQAAATARALAASGFTHARIEIPWDAMDYDNPTRLADPQKWMMLLGALKTNGIRPLVLLNANDGAPGPTRHWTARLSAPAAAGATRVRLDAASAARVVPGRSGIDGPTGAAAQGVFTAIGDDRWATLSQPLPFDLPAGDYPAATRRFLPFGRPFDAAGKPNASFAATRAGWLDYVAAVTQGTRYVLGSDAFDVEVWNELGFGSGFLDAGNYYRPLPASFVGTGSVTGELLAATVAWIRDPAHGVSGVRVGDGFANQTPFASPADLPAGVTALDKHPYRGITPLRPALRSDTPLDALGRTDGWQFGNQWWDAFTPGTDAYFPEYYLSGIQTETLVRDLAPITTTVQGRPHGRNVRSDGPTQTWITETNLERPAGISDGDRDLLQTKVALRTLAAYVNKGATVVDLYAARTKEWGLIPEAFMDQAATGADPGPVAAGPTLPAVGRFLKAFGTPQPLGSRRSLHLEAIADRHDHEQWAGDGTVAHPALKNRDVLAVLPFQTTADSFAVPVYVMTQDLRRTYDASASASDAARRTLPDETYRISLSGLRRDVTASLYDPLTEQELPTTVIPTGPGRVDVELPVTDYPRVLRLTDRG